MRNATRIATSFPGEMVFRARGLTKIYDMGEVQVHALRGVDVDLFSGELVVLLGPSGSGKSTLLNILGGLDTSTGGEVFYRGQDLTRATEKELIEYRRHHLAFRSLETAGRRLPPRGEFSPMGRRRRSPGSRQRTLPVW
ncbi:MAG: ATP-binding cassette domain-containing protein [Candidatus Deferrimicrobiaceae bacterium]